jgi:hypothetical protein
MSDHLLYDVQMHSIASLAASLSDALSTAAAQDRAHRPRPRHGLERQLERLRKLLLDSADGAGGALAGNLMDDAYDAGRARSIPERQDVYELVRRLAPLEDDQRTARAVAEWARTTAEWVGRLKTEGLGELEEHSSEWGQLCIFLDRLAEAGQEVAGPGRAPTPMG